MEKLSLTTLLLLLCATFVYAQEKPKKPVASPRQVLKQDFALSQITINYSRPGVKGRKIFGNHEPYDSVWRTGANAVTTIEFGQDVKLEGHDVKAGKYAIYTIPRKDTWTIILNKDVDVWGTEYNKADDVLRFDVDSKPIAFPIETFTINVGHIRDTSAIIYMVWEHTYVPIQVTTTLSQ
jgi:hypothetical protein